MKKLMKNGILVLVMMMLVGCAPTAKTKQGGSLVLHFNPSIELNYDEHGLVESVKGLNADGALIVKDLPSYEGRHAKGVVKELVRKIDGAGYLIDEVDQSTRKITIELDDDAEIPYEHFLEGIAASVNGYLKSNKYKNQFDFESKYELDDLYEDLDDVNDDDDNDDDDNDDDHDDEE